jgi:succinate-acetate transporter protein
MSEPTVTQIKDTTANPAPLGLLGFGMTTVLLNLHNAGFYELNAMILAMGICYGGIAQVLNELFGKIVLPLGPVKK